MEIETYKVKDNCEILDKVFLIGDIVYATPSFHVMNGVFDYARKVFDSERNYLGMIKMDNFPENCLAKENTYK
jgi:hypothetical protein